MLTKLLIKHTAHGRLIEIKLTAVDPIIDVIYYCFVLVIPKYRAILINTYVFILIDGFGNHMLL